MLKYKIPQIVTLTRINSSITNRMENIKKEAVKNSFLFIYAYITITDVE